MPKVEVHVTSVEEARRAGALDRYRAALTDEERARHARMRPDPRGDEFLVGRALVRHALRRHAPGQPHALVTGPHGRLETAAASFNLSHAEGLVVCAVSARGPIGVDVEKVDEARTEPAIWSQYFAPAEVAALRVMTEEARCERFFRYWTLKEAYLKARGVGLGIPLQDFWFSLAGDEIAVTFSPALGDDPARWRFAQRRLGADYLLAVAMIADEAIELSVEHGLP